MYERQHNLQELEAFGLTPEDYDADGVELLPENWLPFNLFSRLGTQWRVGMAGATGLDYNALYPLLDKQCTTPDEWDNAFADIQVMESAALSEMNRKTD
jgi:hypothetical protein